MSDKAYRDSHKRQISQKKKECYRAKRDIYLKKMKQYAAKHKDEIKKYKKEYHKKNAEYLCKKSNDWYYKNKTKARIAALKYYHKTKKYPNIYIKTVLRSRIINSLKKYKQSGVIKKDNTKHLIGCDIAFFIKYIESRFLPNMSWQNYGRFGWHIDHIKPCCRFDLSKPEEQKKCFHYTNLQPLWWRDNLKKQGKYYE